MSVLEAKQINKFFSGLIHKVCIIMHDPDTILFISITPIVKKITVKSLSKQVSTFSEKGEKVMYQM